MRRKSAIPMDPNVIKQLAGHKSIDGRCVALRVRVPASRLLTFSLSPHSLIARQSE